MNSNPASSAPESVLAALRRLVPERSLLQTEALRVAELQATTLRRLTDTVDGVVSDDIVASLPRMHVRYSALPTSGMSYWDRATRRWIIVINGSEPLTRQRFTLLHEFKHILDHGRTDRLYGADRQASGQRAEQACDYFAGCVLMPKRLLKRAWGQGIQTPAALADHFDVSPRAAEVRLAQTGLGQAPDRHAPRHLPRGFAARSGSWYYRPFSGNDSSHALVETAV